MSTLSVSGSGKLTLVRKIADGGFSQVFLVRGVSSGAMMALKQVICQDRAAMDNAVREVEVLRRFKGNPHIVELVESDVVPANSPSLQPLGHEAALNPQVLMLFPLYGRGTAFDEVTRALADEEAPWPFSEERVLRLTAGMCEALAAMHASGLAHRDMKPHNVLLSEQDEAVIMDLGSAAPVKHVLRSSRDALQLEDDASVNCTLSYRAPELVDVPRPRGEAIEIDVAACDMWGVGCTIFCVAFGHSPFEDASGVQRLAILNGQFRIPHDRTMRDRTFSEALCGLIAACLDADPRRRPTAQGVLGQCRAMQAQARGRGVE